MLKALFSSNTRVKLLTTFLMNPDEEYFIRELTRKLDEQINSIRRELDNLKKIGLLRSKMKNRKKFYHLNQDFPIYHELRGIFMKASNTDDELVQKILELGPVELLVLHGAFIGKESAVDLLVVGDIDKAAFQKVLSSTTKPKPDIHFAILPKKEFLYRLECKDKFVHSLLNDKASIIAVNKMKKDLR